MSAVLLRAVLGVLLFSVACSGRVARNSGAALESTGTTHEALSCITESSIANLPHWSAAGTYAEGDQVQDGAAAWGCIDPGGCPTIWEPGSPGTSDLWVKAPVCGIQPWTPGTQYDPGTVVSYNGQFYQDLTQITAIPGQEPPTDPADWQAFDPSAGAPGAVGDPTQLEPIVNCVAQDGSGQYTAVFGYSNSTTATIVAPIGPTNAFIVPAPPAAPSGRGQPISFAPGETDGAFVVDFDGTPLTWQLGDTSVTASSSSPACTTTQGPDGPVVTFGGSSVLLHPDPTTILAGSLLPTETVPTTGYASGGLHGGFSVTGDGAATYQIPIWTPPGRMGMKPNLSLSYSSRSQSTLAGYGWNIAGFGVSRIARCHKSVAQDGDVSPISFGLTASFTDNDAFCLDGARLIGTGAQNADGSQSYVPEHDPFTRVVLSADRQWFTAYHRDGSVFTYGGTLPHLSSGTLYAYQPAADGSGAQPNPSSSVIFEWGLNTVTDATGNNAMSVTWQVDYAQPPSTNFLCQEMVPQQILYAASRSVHFTYVTESNPKCKFVSGFAVGSFDHLTQIDVSGPTGGGGVGVLRSYKMQYAPGGTTNRTLLHSVQECEGSGVCTAPTTFDYEEGSKQFTPVNGPSNAGIFSDINGDGKDDLVYSDTPTYSNHAGPGTAPGNVPWFPPTSYFSAALSNGQTFASPFRLTIGNYHPTEFLHAPPVGPAALVTFDGLARFLQSSVEVIEERPNPPDADLGLASAGFVDVVGQQTFKTLPIAWGVPPWVVEDIDGDGRADLIAVDSTTQTATNPNLRYALASQSFANALLADPLGNALSSADPLLGIYEYGVPLETGKTALLLRGANTSGVSGLPPGITPQYLDSVVASPIDGSLSIQQTTLTAGFDWGAQLSSGGGGYYYLFIDLNNDGNADALQVPVSGGPPQVAYNTGAGFSPIQALPGANAIVGYPSPVTLGPLVLPPANSPNAVNVPVSTMHILDVTGDGLPDIVISQLTAQGDLLPLQVWATDGTGGVEPPFLLYDSTGAPITAFSWATLDFNGDGVQDLSTGTNLYVHAGKQPDELTGIHDGFGKDIVVTYKSIGDTTVYTPDTGCTYPQHCTNKGMWVVSQYTATTDAKFSGNQGSSPTEAFNYTYAGGRSDLRGRGWLGFSTQTIVNAQTLSATTMTFDNGSAADEVDTGFGYPKAGLPLKSVVTGMYSVPGQSGAPTVVNTAITVNYTYNVLPVGSTAITQTQQTETTVEEDSFSGTGPAQKSILSDTTTAYQYDDFNNVKLRTTTYSSGEVRSSAAQYTQNTSGGKYLLSLLQSTSETSSVPGYGAVTRTHFYDPDRNTGLLDDETIQPDGDPSQKLVIIYNRNAYGQVTHLLATAADPLNVQPALTREAWTTYDPTDSVFPVSTSNALGHTTRMVFHPGLGGLVFSQDPNGVTSHGQFDGFGRSRTSSTQGQATVNFSYQGGQLIRGQPGDIPGLWTIETSDTLGGDSFVTYDALGHPVMRGSKNHDGTFSYVQTVYTGVLSGQVYSVSRPYGENGTPVTTTFKYDQLGRRIRRTLPDGSVIHTYFHGLAATVNDANGYARTLVVDDRGRTVQVDEDSTPDAWFDPTLASPPSTATVISTAYAYGPFGLPSSVSIRQRGGSAFTTTSSMRYDARGRRTDLFDADRGHAVTTYDAFSEPSTDLDANGQTHILTRDAIGRTTVDYSTQDGSATFEWDTATHGVGKLAKATSTDKVSSTYAYDGLSRGIETKWHIHGQDFAVDSVLDDATGRVKTLEYPAVGAQQLSVTYGFDAIGAVSTLTGSDASAPITWTATAWETDGQLNTESLNDGEQTIREHDPARGWLKSILTSATSATQIQEVQDLHYDHDANGNVKGRTDELLGTTETFGHDFLNRLQTWGFTTSEGSWTTTYAIDDLGNLQSRTTTGQGAPPAQIYQAYGTRDGSGANPTAPGLHAVTSINDNAYSYDTEGNQLTGPDRTVTYTSFGLPKTVQKSGKTTSFKYDANHQRVYKKGGGASTVYAGGLYEKRTDSSGNVTHVFFVPGGSRVVGQIEWTVDSSGAVNGHNVVYFHDDHLGSVEAVTGPSITGTTHLKYDPFGGRISPTNPTVAGKAPANVTDGFTDQEHDDELGLINFQGRIYDPSIARFISADPLAAQQMGSQAFNRYSYVGNCPLSFVDPTGFIFDAKDPVSQSGGNGGSGGDSGDSSDSGNGTGIVCDGCGQNPDSYAGEPIGDYCARTGVCRIDPETGQVEVFGEEVVVHPKAPDSTDDVAPPLVDSNGVVQVAGGNDINARSGDDNNNRREDTFSHAVAFTAGVGVGAGTAAALTAVSIACPVCGVVIGIGLAGYAAYSLLNGGAEQIAATASRFYNGTATDDDYFALGNAVGGIAEGGLTSAVEGDLAGVTAAEAEGCAGGACTVPGQCFVAGTPVETCDRGEQPIDELEPGEEVLSRDPETGVISCQPIVRTFKRQAGDLGRVTYTDAGGKQETIVATLSHPFWVNGRGWVALGDVADNDALQAASGETLYVSALQALTGRPTDVYNIEVKSNHTYFVGKTQVWVHNACGGIGPVLKGQAGVAKSEAAAIARGETVVGREVTIDTAGGRVRVDLITKDASGTLKAIDAKNGPGAGYTPNQTTGYPALQTIGGIPRGANAAGAGLTPGTAIGPMTVQVDWW